MLKLRRAGMVSTNALLGHTLDHTTSKLIVPLCITFYENMTNLSRFWHLSYCSLHFFGKRKLPIFFQIVCNALFLLVFTWYVKIFETFSKIQKV